MEYTVIPYTDTCRQHACHIQQFPCCSPPLIVQPVWCHGVQARPVDFGSCPSPLGSLSYITVTTEQQAQHTKQCPVCGMSRVWMQDTLSAGQTTWSLSCPIKNKQCLRKSCAPNLAKCSLSIGVFGWVMHWMSDALTVMQTRMLHRMTPCKPKKQRERNTHTHTHTHTRSLLNDMKN